LDGDIWRNEKNNNNFTLDGRFFNISSAVKKAKEIEKEYDDIIFSFIMPDKELRKYIRSSFNESVTLYIPGGKIWPNTVYERPEPQEIGYFKNDKNN
jgi:adenylylsulfate kinase-like enzyme